MEKTPQTFPHSHLCRALIEDLYDVYSNRRAQRTTI
jgi:hypothetical protein